MAKQTLKHIVELMLHLWVEVHSPGVMHESKMCVVQLIVHLHKWL